MKPVFKSLLAAATFAVAATGAQAQEAKSLKELLEQVQDNRVSETRINKQREAEFQAARADKQALLRKAQSELKAEQGRGDRLQKQFSDNEVTLNEKSAELDQATGTLGEMFGVVRQAASEAYGRVSTSIVSAQFPGRSQFLAEMSEDSKGLPNIQELEDLWFALQKEMTENKLDANVKNQFENVTYKGENAGSPFTVDAVKAEIREDDNIIFMKTMLITISLTDREWIVECETGKYNKLNHNIFCSKNVKATDGKTIVYSQNLDLLTDESAKIYNDVIIFDEEESNLYADSVYYDFKNKVYTVNMFSDNESVKIKLIK